MNTQLHPIDFETWDRRQYFYYFTEMLPTGFNLNVEIDITKTYQKIKEDGKKFFPAYLYLAAKLITEQPEFRVAKTDDMLGYYEVLHPSYACFHEDDKTMSHLWTEYDANFESFYRNYLNDQEEYSGNHGILAKPELPPPNSFMVGMLPWTQFTSYAPIPYSKADYYFPILQAGRFYEKNGRKIMPFSITVHHAVADGYHVGLFLEKFQAAMNQPEQWIRL